MKRISKINLSLKDNAPKKVKEQADYFVKNNENYLIDFDMKLFNIPTDTNFYKDIITFYNENLKHIYSPGEDIFYKYDKKDYQNAVAFVLNIHYLWYGYPDTTSADLYEYCCNKKCVAIKQIKDEEMPKGSLKNKDFGDLMNGRCAVSERMKAIIISLGANDNDFRPIWSRKDRTVPVCYQIEPQNILPPMTSLPNIRVVEGCVKNKNVKLYDMDTTMPMYITKEALSNLKILNRTYETYSWMASPFFVISREAFETLSKYVKPVNFTPMFLYDE